MNFRKINEGGAQRDDGVTVQIKHADYLEYREGGRAVDISIGYDPRMRQVFVYASEIDSWNRPDPTVGITEDQKKEIVDNLKEALSCLKGNFIVS